MDVAGEDDVIEAEDASAGDIGGGTDGGRPRAVGRDDDLIHQVSAGGGARHIKVQRSIAGAGIRIAEGDRTRTQGGNVADVDLAVADDGAAREGVSDRASHGQGTCARLDDGAEASQDVAGRVGERDINRAVINRDDGRGNRPGEGDVIVSQRGGVIDGDDVTVDELVGQGGRCVGEVQRGGASVPGVASCTRPGERTIAQLQVNRIARDREGRQLAVATGAGQHEVGRRGVRRSEGQNREGVRIGRTVQEVHRDRAIDRQGTERGEARGRQRVGLEGRIVIEGNCLGGAQADEVGAGDNRQVGVINRTGEVQGTDGDRGRTRVGVRARKDGRTGAQLVEAGITRDGRIDSLRARSRQGQRTAAVNGERTAARDVILDCEATG